MGQGAVFQVLYGVGGGKVLDFRCVLPLCIYTMRTDYYNMLFRPKKATTVRDGSVIGSYQYIIVLNYLGSEADEISE